MFLYIQSLGENCLYNSQLTMLENDFRRLHNLEAGIICNNLTIPCREALRPSHLAGQHHRESERRKRGTHLLSGVCSAKCKGWRASQEGLVLIFLTCSSVSLKMPCPSSSKKRQLFFFFFMWLLIIVLLELVNLELEEVELEPRRVRVRRPFGGNSNLFLSKWPWECPVTQARLAGGASYRLV